MILLDAGVWLAAAWGRHLHHPPVAAWINRQPDGLVLCRVTQMSLLRLLTNPAVMRGDVVTRGQAWGVVDAIRGDDRTHWADEPASLEPVWRALYAQADSSHKVWTDDYLAAFAQAAGYTFATLDRAVEHRYPSVQVNLLV